MTPIPNQKLRDITGFPELIRYLADELEWPFESFAMDDLTFDWDSDQLKVSDSQSRQLKNLKPQNLRDHMRDRKKEALTRTGS